MITFRLRSALALLLIVLALYLAFLPALDSPLTRALGNPALYAGPLGWFTGCAAQPTATPAAVTPEVIEQTAPPPTQIPSETPMEIPLTAEPFPLWHVVPETLYWRPDARTDEQGIFAVDIPLPEKPAAWRGTVLASTLAGDIGSATFELRVGER